jgi:transposase InsO family protein
MVLDVRSRNIVGWAMENHLRTELVLAATNMALAQRPPNSVIHHSDRGCQYTSYAFGKRCQEMGAMLSMGSVGDPPGAALELLAVFASSVRRSATECVMSSSRITRGSWPQ